jgi:hypothetical protein
LKGDFEYEDSLRSINYSLLGYGTNILDHHLDDIGIGIPNHGDRFDLDEVDPKKMPKWWHNRSRDYHREARASRKLTWSTCFDDQYPRSL